MARVFLSFTPRDDGRAKLVGELINDLAEEIGLLTGWPEDDIVHSGLSLGDDRQDAVLAALRDCDVFVPLLSPSYIRDERCGKEWWLFEQRIRKHSERHGDRPPVIIPILWELPSREFVIPDIARRIEYVGRDLLDIYEEMGLRRLVQNQKKKYRTAKNLLAERMVRVAGDKALSVADDDWDVGAAVNVFDSLGGSNGSQEPGPSGSRGARGWKKVQFVVAAATETQIDKVRGGDGRYGSEPLDWRPYGGDTPLVNDASSIALKERLTPSARNVDSDIQTLIDRMEEEQQLVVLLVDPWTLRLTSYRDLVRQYDRRQWLHTGVMVVWDERDPATAAERKELNTAVESAFRVTHRKDALTYNDATGNPVQFVDELAGVLTRIHGLLLKDRKADVRKAEAVDPSAREVHRRPPRLGGPGGVG